jgi:hypothetical protein
MPSASTMSKVTAAAVGAAAGTKEVLVFGAESGVEEGISVRAIFSLDGVKTAWRVGETVGFVVIAIAVVILEGSLVGIAVDGELMLGAKLTVVS